MSQRIKSESVLGAGSRIAQFVSGEGVRKFVDDQGDDKEG